ncbi:hypothetical protein Afil01_16930 [Actinorhabdospora filicis]|uniref:Uncharacterized protein n=1 Tax=Actinorhabdospora filicis TaxID=1785913 RepID=A0A9W6SLP5_9ACTN|nr:DUF6228 family protein [Actinorhabdospora filicis]GLZ76886.1 hypothetical protein Afil01_16930 [Actinorhabdospora filicis]
MDDGIELGEPLAGDVRLRVAEVAADDSGDGVVELVIAATGTDVDLRLSVADTSTDGLADFFDALAEGGAGSWRSIDARLSVTAAPEGRGRVRLRWVLSSQRLHQAWAFTVVTVLPTGEPLRGVAEGLREAIDLVLGYDQTS